MQPIAQFVLTMQRHLFLSGHAHLRPGPAKDGDARPVRRQPRSDGAAPRQGKIWLNDLDTQSCK